MEEIARDYPWVVMTVESISYVGDVWGVYVSENDATEGAKNFLEESEDNRIAIIAKTHSVVKRAVEKKVLEHNPPEGLK